jgi:hypothetical protein
MKQFKCINSFGYWLTPGKIYNIKLNASFYKEGKNQHLIVNDKGIEHYIYDDELQQNFIEIEIFREQQLNKLGI